MTKFKANIENEFEIPDLGNLTYFLRMEIEDKKYEFFLHQKNYAEDILKKLNISNCNPTIALMETRIKLKNNSYEEFFM